MRIAGEMLSCKSAYCVLQVVNVGFDLRIAENIIKFAYG